MEFTNETIDEKLLEKQQKIQAQMQARHEAIQKMHKLGQPLQKSQRSHSSALFCTSMENYTTLILQSNMESGSLHPNGIGCSIRIILM